MTACTGWHVLTGKPQSEPGRAAVLAARERNCAGLCPDAQPSVPQVWLISLCVAVVAAPQKGQMPPTSQHGRRNCH